MKRRLILLRHAKSAWNTGHTDHDRPLNKRGQRAAPRMGALMVDRGYVPQRVISSDAQRTRETWDGVQESLSGLEAEFSHRLYLASAHTIANIIATQDGTLHTMLLIGHNPGMSELASWLSGQDVELKTATAAVLEIESDGWTAAMNQGAWSLIDLFRPPQAE